MLTKIDELNRPEYEAIDYYEWFSAMDIPEEDIEKRVDLAEEIDDIYFDLFALITAMSAMGEYQDKFYYEDYIRTRLDDVVARYDYPYLNEYASISAENTANTTFEHLGEEYYTSDERASRLAAENAQTIANYTEYQSAIEQGMNVKIWHSEKDGRVRKTHKEVDGTKIGITEFFKVGKTRLLFPCDAVNCTDLREIINCRCYAKPSYDPNFKEVALSDETERIQKDERSVTEQPVRITENTDSTKTSLTIRVSNEHPSEKRMVIKDVTAEYKKNSKKEAVVTESDRFIDNKGNTHFVNGKQVKIRTKPGERETAETLSKFFGTEVTLVPEVKYPQNINTPDYIINGKKYDMKSVDGESNDVLYNAISHSKSQADNFVFVKRKTPLSTDDLVKQAKELFNRQHTKYINSVIIIDDDKVIKVLEKRLLSTSK